MSEPIHYLDADMNSVYKRMASRHSREAAALCRGAAARRRYPIVKVSALDKKQLEACAVQCKLLSYNILALIPPPVLPEASPAAGGLT